MFAGGSGVGRSIRIPYREASLLKEESDRMWSTLENCVTVLLRTSTPLKFELAALIPSRRIPVKFCTALAPTKHPVMLELSDVVMLIPLRVPTLMGTRGFKEPKSTRPTRGRKAGGPGSISPVLSDWN